MDIPTLSLAKSRARGVPVEGGREGPAAAPDHNAAAGGRCGAGAGQRGLTTPHREAPLQVPLPGCFYPTAYAKRRPWPRQHPMLKWHRHTCSSYC